MDAGLSGVDVGPIRLAVTVKKNGQERGASVRSRGRSAEEIIVTGVVSSRTTTSRKSMILQTARTEFVISAAHPNQFPAGDLPEVAFAGRSNVGKSSLLNMLVGRRSLARISATPGKTQQINFFRLDDHLHLVDLPGYGFAKVSKADRLDWARLIEQYIAHRPQLRLVVSLVDIRHDPTALDRDMFAWLESVGMPFLVVLTKHDKVSPLAATERRNQVVDLLSGHSFCRGVIAVSSRTRHNRDPLLREIEHARCSEGSSKNRA